MLTVNYFIFPAPKFYDITSIKRNLVFVPKNYGNTSRNQPQKTKQDKNITKKSLPNQKTYLIHPTSNAKDFIPCLYLKGQNIKKIMIYFHGNAQDITQVYTFVQCINENFKYPIFAVQYPGYSIYPGTPTSESIQADSLQIVKYCQLLGYNLEDIIVVGRSIGSGPAFHIASRFKLGALIVISPFISLRNVIADLYGKMIGMLVEERFDNLQKCRRIQTPCLLIHGRQDKMIRYEHSMRLAQVVRSYCQLKVIQNMSHCRFNFDYDFVMHAMNFLKKVLKQ